MAFYGAGKGVEALERSVRRNNGNSRAAGKYIDKEGNRYNKISDVTIARQHKLLPVIVVLNGAEMEDSHENTRLKDEIHRNIWRGR